MMRRERVQHKIIVCGKCAVALRESAVKGCLLDEKKRGENGAFPDGTIAWHVPCVNVDDIQ